MKTITYLLLSILPMWALTGCADDDGTNPIPGNGDLPHIYVTWQPNAAYKLGDKMSFQPQVSPSDGATYKWTLNGEVISTEATLDYELKQYLFDADLKFEVTRNGVSNHREAKVLVVKDYVPKQATYKSIAWLTKNGQPADVNWENISHLIVSAAEVKEDGTLDASFAQKINVPLLLSFAHHYGVQVLIEIADAGLTPLNAVPVYGKKVFYENAITGSKRDALIANIAKVVSDYNFDGVNICMSKATDAAFAEPAALKVFYEKLGEKIKSSKNTIEGKEYDYQLSMSVYGGWTNASLSGMVNLPAYDWINVLAFAAEDLTPGPHASLWYATDQLTQWINWHSVAKKRIVLGVPAFGLRYFGTPKDYTWANLGQYTEYKSYKDICAATPDAPSKNTIIVKEFNGNKDVEVNQTYYDGLAEVAAKAQHIKTNNLGGIALWASEGDSKDPAKSLMKKINDTLNP